MSNVQTPAPGPKPAPTPVPAQNPGSSNTLLPKESKGWDTTQKVLTGVGLVAGAVALIPVVATVGAGVAAVAAGAAVVAGVAAVANLGISLARSKHDSIGEMVADIAFTAIGLIPFVGAAAKITQYLVGLAWDTGLVKLMYGKMQDGANAVKVLIAKIIELIKNKMKEKALEETPAQEPGASGSSGSSGGAATGGAAPASDTPPKTPATPDNKAPQTPQQTPATPDNKAPQTSPQTPEKTPPQDTAQSKDNADFIWPVLGSYVEGCPFGKHPCNVHTGEHGGIDIKQCNGATVVATADGKVSASNNSCGHVNTLHKECGGGWGNYIIIDHGNGMTSIYAHLKQNSIPQELRKNGQPVTKGTTIGIVGSSGNSTGPHLHFEIRVNNIKKDPKQYLK